MARSRRGCRCGGMGTGGAPRSTRAQQGRKLENPALIYSEWAKCRVEGARLTQQRKRQEKMGPYRESRLIVACYQRNIQVSPLEYGICL